MTCTQYAKTQDFEENHKMSYLFSKQQNYAHTFQWSYYWSYAHSHENSSRIVTVLNFIYSLQQWSSQHIQQGKAIEARLRRWHFNQSTK